MSQTQMNIRIDSSLRSRGNLALENAGVTPSQAVRLLWSFAADHCDDPQIISDELARLRSGSGGDEIDIKMQKLESLRRATHIVEDFREQLGINTPLVTDDTPYADLRDEILFDRLEERGLL